MSALRPLSVGEVIDRSASFWRSHWKPLFQLFLGFQLVQYVLLKAAEVALEAQFPGGLNPMQAVELVKRGSPQTLSTLGPVFGLSLVATLANLFLSQLAGMAITAFVYPRLTQADSMSPQASLGRAFRRAGVGLGLFLLSLAWALIIGVACLVPGAAVFGGGLSLLSDSTTTGTVLAVLGAGLMLLGVLVVGVWFLLRFMLSAQVVAIEDIGVRQAFLRTAKLSSGRVAPGLLGLVKSRLTVLLTVVLSILLILGFLTSIPELVLTAVFGGFDPSIGTRPPQVMLVPAQLIQVFVGAMVGPLYVVFQVVFYLDMRVRREGVDLDLLAQRSPA